MNKENPKQSKKEKKRTRMSNRFTQTQGGKMKKKKSVYTIFFTNGNR